MGVESLLFIGLNFGYRIQCFDIFVQRLMDYWDLRDGIWFPDLQAMTLDAYFCPSIFFFTFLSWPLSTWIFSTVSILWTAVGS